MPTHMQAREITCADGMQKRGRSPGEIVAKLQRGRSPKRNRGPSKTAVYRFLPGSAYVRGQNEARGRKSMLRHSHQVPRAMKTIVPEFNTSCVCPGLESIL